MDQGHVNVDTFIKSMRRKEQTFQSHVAYTKERVSALNGVFKQIQKRTTPLLRCKDDPVFALQQRKIEREAKIITPRPVHYSPLDTSKLYDYERELRKFKKENDKRSLLSAIETIPFSAEKYTQFTVNAQKQYIHSSYPSMFTPGQGRNTQSMMGTIPRVAMMRK